MKKISTLIGSILSLAVSVSAFGQVSIPTYKSPATVSVSSASMGAWTEVFAGEFQIANSDVYLYDPTRNTSAASFLGALFLGIPGAFIGGALEISAGQKDASGSGAVYVTKFDQELGASLSRQVESETRKSMIKLVANDQDADIVLRPAVRFIKLSEKANVMSVRLAVALKDPATGKALKREYQTTFPDQLALAGLSESWAADNGKAFKARAIEGIDLSVHMLLKQLAGELKLPEAEKDQKRITLKSLLNGRVSEHVILEETDAYFFTNIISSRRVISHVTLAIDKSSVEIQQK
jgi:hypothetical protein